MHYSISFIIPAYNAQDHILTCLDSITKLKYDNYNIILIDDGSIDLTERIVKEHNISNLYYHKQTNQGVSSARNLGINSCDSDYIMFIDSDDIICPEGIEQAIDYINSHDVNILCIDYEEIGAQEKKTIGLDYSNGCYGKEVLHNLRYSLLDYKIGKNYKSSYVGAKVFQYIIKRKLLDRKNEFPKGIPYAEDLCFFYTLFGQVETIDVLHVKGYEYYIREESAAHRFRKNIWLELNDVYHYVCRTEENQQLYYSLVIQSVYHYIYMIPIMHYFRRVSYVKKIINCIDMQSIINEIEFSDWTMEEKQINRYIIQKKPYKLVLFIDFQRIKKKMGIGK